MKVEIFLWLVSKIIAKSALTYKDAFDISFRSCPIFILSSFPFYNSELLLLDVLKNSVKLGHLSLVV